MGEPLEPAATETRPGAKPDDIRLWTVAQLRGFMVDAASFLEDLERDDLNPEARLRLVAHARSQLAPLTLAPRSDARAEIVGFLHRFAVAPEIFGTAARLALTGEGAPSSADEICQLLDLMVDADAGAERVVFQLAESAAVAGLPEGSLPRAQSALCYLAAASGAAGALAMAERLRRTAGLTLPAAVAVLWITASRQPGLLAAALRDLQPELEAEGPDAGQWLYQAVKDMVRRSSALVVLEAMARLIPREHPRLFVAAFGGPKPLFRFAWRREPMGFNEDGTPRSRESLMVRWPALAARGELLVDTITDHKTWHLDVGEVARVRPDSEADAGSRFPGAGSGGAFVRDADVLAARNPPAGPSGGFAERFRQQMLH